MLDRSSCAENLEPIFVELRKRVSPLIFRNWIAPVCIELKNENELVIATQSSFHAEKIKRDYLKIVQEILETLYPERHIKVNIDISSPPTESIKAPSSAPDPSLREPSHPNVIEMPKSSRSTGEAISTEHVPPPPPHSTSNKLMMRVIEDISHRPDEYDTVFVYGPPGSGKTTYLQYLRRCLNSIQLPTAYVTIDEFTGELVQALQSQTIQKFRTKFKEKFKAILFDDFHMVSNRSKTQEELAHMLQLWKNSGVKVVFVSQASLDAAVRNELLRSRLQSGLVLPVSPPDFSCIQQMVNQQLTCVSDEVRHWTVHYCVKKVSSLHTLKGILNRMRVESGLCQKTFDKQAIADIVDEFVPQSEALPDLNPARVTHLVCQFYQIDTHDLCGKRRTKTLTEARRICVYLLRKRSTLSLSDIGSIIGRDHTTVLHAFQKMEAALTSDATLVKHLQFFEEKLALPPLMEGPVETITVEPTAPVSPTSTTLH